MPFKPNVTATIAALATACAAAASASAAPLSLTLDGVEARGGTLYISVQNEAQFLKNSGTAGEMIATPTAGTHSFTYEVPAGRYVVSIWHDDDGDGEFSLTEDGMPADGWAMSNMDKLTGEPEFDTVAIEVDESGASLTLPVLYGR